MYERLTKKTKSGYEADGLMAVERLGRLEDVIERLQNEYNQTVEAMKRLSSQGKEKSATYQQLWANKAALKETLIRLGCG